MENETNQDLLVIITMQEDEPVAANKAFRVFYHRLYRYVKFVAWKLTASIKKDREAVAADIVTDTFRDVFHNYKSKGYFDPQKCKDIEKGIRNWLSGIARNHLLRYLEEIAKVSKPISYLDSWPDHLFFELDDQESIPPPPNLKALNAALDTLDDKQREILLSLFNLKKKGIYLQI